MTEQKMNEQKTAEEKMTGQKPAEQKIPEENMAGQKPAEQKIREEKTAEQKAASESLSDENLSEEDISEDKDPEENDAGEAPRTIDKSILRKANRYFFSKVIVNIILIILGAVLISMFLRRLQENAAIVKQQENCVLALGEAVSMLEENVENAKTLSQIYHDSNQDVLDDMHRLFLSGLFDSLADADKETRAEVVRDIIERSGVDYMFVLTMDGKIAAAPEAELDGVNPAAASIMTQENLNRILKGSRDRDGNITPETVKNLRGTFYFYSLPYTFKGTKYVLTLGKDASILDVHISTLTDVSVVLSRASVSNNGFMFAVDQKDGTFLYYINGEEILTGQSAFKAGLSKDALNDGYVGTEEINGAKYYCVSKTFGDQTVVCAVAQMEKVMRNDKSVLFWSILGFILFMLLCLSYAIIVRNDFVKNAVETDRVALFARSKNPVYFDKSIFKKVFPLMLTGIILIFGISFYTQTLIEISDGIEVSKVALDEVSARYEDNTVSRETIQEYYNEQFLGKARLIAFFLEDDPSVLNEASDHYYSIYDESGSRKYLTDDEGNRLKSVSSSAALQELCISNDIDSIYIFDENGRTIGTSTPNWFFELSHNEEDQSYEFLQVLDGRVDGLVQEAKVTDVGEETQFIGVAFNYYTKVDKNGQTRYVSRYEYEREAGKAKKAQEDSSAGITLHRSLVQIGLAPDISNKLLESTEVSNILSTNMLSNGYILMFDSSEDHLCVYSPNEASISRPASELGISGKAFSGNQYYGFTSINGVNYFLYSRYAEKYFLITALPSSEMFQMRGRISLITAIISFVLITFLLGTVTLTNKEEEELYAEVSEADSTDRLDSVIFNVILPSGRRVSTMTAAARWDNRRIPWKYKSPEQKLLLIISVVCGILLLAMLLTYMRVNPYSDEDSTLRYIASGGWDRGRNIFAFSACVAILAAVSLLIALFRIPVRIITALLGTRGETIGHLLLSVIKYGGTLGTFFYCLYLLGIDSSSLIASAGILSLVIGLGAQSLIKDIIAGIFIVFEGEFRVGDIVTIGNYRGTVMDIGLRTTKILGGDGNIKIYNNSEISGILNMTQQASLAMCEVGIEYGQDIDYVEAVLERELPEISKANRDILEGPTYQGVQTLGESGVRLLITCKCSEQNVKAVNRYLNRSILQIFYRNKINIPFPNVTFSMLNEDNRMTMDDLLANQKKTEDFPGD